MYFMEAHMWKELMQAQMIRKKKFIVLKHLNAFSLIENRGFYSYVILMLFKNSLRFVAI